MDDGEIFTDEDFSLLERYMLARHSQTIADQIETWEVEHENERYMLMISYVCNSTHSTRKLVRNTRQINERRSSKTLITAIWGRMDSLY